MKQIIEAAIRCEIGKVRTNNEDNFYFDGKTLKKVNKGMPKTKHKVFSSDDVFFGVFDGMGGEACGEVASYMAASEVKAFHAQARKAGLTTEELLHAMCLRMNDAVCRQTVELSGGRMGSTAVSVLFEQDSVYVCNLGDSRAFRLRGGELVQLSEDHTDEKINLSLGIKRKPRLTQHLGIFPDEMILEPFVEKLELQAGDRYLLCSDGLTDMLTNEEICGIMLEQKDLTKCVDTLMDAALERGGRDNTTIIVCQV